MGYHPRIECKDIATFQTTRARNSELWFVNNDDLEHYILGYAARYSGRYGVKLYALAIEGNHIQMPAKFPLGNRASFMRDFNSSVARAVARHQSAYSGGRLWARRYSAEYLPGVEDVEDRFFYTVLQPVNDGLVDDIRDYPGYNCFEDAITGSSRKFRVVRWKDFNDARRWDPDVRIEDFTEWCSLEFSRLPGYENLSQSQYETLMRKKLAQRTRESLATRRVRRSLGAERMRCLAPGTRPKRTKVSGRYDYRPRVLSKCQVRRSTTLAWYYDIHHRFKACSRKYRAGDADVVFPHGTYKPPAFTVAFVGEVT